MKIVFIHQNLPGQYKHLAAALADGAFARARDLLAVNRALTAAGRIAEVEVVQTEADLENQRIRVLEAVKGLDAARLLLLDLLALDLGTAIVARNERLWDVSLVATGRLGRESIPDVGTESSRASDMTAGLSLAIPLNGFRRDRPYVQASMRYQTSELQLAAIRQGWRCRSAIP